MNACAPHILLSAYAVRPDHGSEQEVGWQALQVAAEVAPTWLLTTIDDAAVVRARLRAHPPAHPVAVHGLGSVLADGSQGIRFQWREQTHYEAWQRQAAGVAGELHRRHPFTVAHHVTFASYWKRCGIAQLPLPVVVGPVGGGLSVPFALWPGLGIGGIGEELLRAGLRSASARRPGVRTGLRLAEVVLVQNTETEQRLPAGCRTRILPHLVAAPERCDPPAGTRRSREILVAARLVRWKRVDLAIAAFRRLDDPTARLVICGAGPDEHRLRRLTHRLGLGERTLFAGRVPRADLLDRLRSAAALLHPAAREEGGLAVAEALSMSTPVIALRRGGPRVAVEQLWPSSPSSLTSAVRRGPLVAQLAEALGEALAWSPPTVTTPVASAHDWLAELRRLYIELSPPA